MITKTLTFILACILTCSAYAQVQKSVNNVGENVIVKSEILNEEREIQIYVPDHYDQSDEKYPVLFVLDGQRYFLHAVSLQKSFVEFRQTPPFIVVGITKKTTERNRNFSSNADAFLNFIEKEVITFVDAHYRTSKERLLFGWAFAGGFTIQAMSDKPNLFDAYIAASPYPAAQKVPGVDSMLNENVNFDKLLYFTSDVGEGVVTEGTITLNKLLLDKAPETMRWNFREFDGEQHRSTPYPTLYHGVTSYFSHYPELQFNTLEQLLDAGGLDRVYDYYQKRASQYGFSKDLSDWTMFSITRNAIRANDVAYFEQFMTRFEPTGFINRLRVSRACVIAEFYLKHQQPDKAITLFSVLAEKHPDSERPLKGLGDAYLQLNQNKKANQFYKRAEQIANNNSQ